MRRFSCCLCVALLVCANASASAAATPPVADRSEPAPAPLSSSPAPSSPPASSAPAPSSAAATQKLVDAYVEGADQYFQQKKYVDSAEELKRAYELEHRAIFLFNMGQCYRKAAMPKEALASYQQFLTEVPGHELAGEARAYSADMKLLLAEQTLREAQMMAAETAKKQLLLEQRATEETRQQLVREQQRVQEAQRQLAQAKRPVYKRAWFWGVVGGSALAVALAFGVGLGVGLKTQSRATDGGFVDISF